ncbi:hypothetical protein Q3G72_018240 [Acer saccharum]|nr:hypothetical protein Q3G72_018240 [Acer saccharum]
MSSQSDDLSNHSLEKMVDDYKGDSIEVDLIVSDADTNANKLDRVTLAGPPDDSKLSEEKLSQIDERLDKALERHDKVADEAVIETQGKLMYEYSFGVMDSWNPSLEANDDEEEDKDTEKDDGVNEAVLLEPEKGNEAVGDNLEETRRDKDKL